MKNKIIKNISRVLMFALLINVVPNTVSFAAEMSIYDQNRLLGATSTDWQSANIREWLNSDKLNVDYTGLPPSYQSESGFISDNNFTSSERDGIAVTRHGAGIKASVGDNMNKTLYLSQRSVATNYYLYNDKVFILHYSDLVNYIERNKDLMNSNKKYYSNYLQRTTNKKDKYDYVVNSGNYNGGYLGISILFTSILNQVNTRSQNNIVPALSLKPDYTLSNGVKAKDLTLGQTVTFGKYNGEPIEWQVINISDSGYPLLWSTKILAIKEYDKEGDINPNTSNYITFNSYDVDITSGNGGAKSWETKNKIDSLPVIGIENESVLTTPTNDTQITLKINVTDSKYSIRKIILPNGEEVSGSKTEYTLTQNGEYDIIAENSNGNLTVRHIVTNAINAPASVEITTDKDNSTKWTNKPVNVTISPTNYDIYTITTPGKTSGYGAISGNSFVSWMSLRSKRLRITGTFKNAISDEDATKIDMNAHITIRLITRSNTNNSVFQTEIETKKITLKELKEKGEIYVDEIVTLPTNIYDYCYPLIRLMYSNSAYMKAPYSYGASNFTYEILDKDDLKIEEILLPDGNKVYTDRTTYTIYKNGSYTFSAKDNRGKTTSKTIDLAIDTVKPNIDIVPATSKLTTELSLKVNATDDLSGIKSIKLPNGEYRTTSSDGQNLSIDYNIIKNGNYTFETTDYAGNTYSKTISVTNVDNTPPILNLSYNSNPTNSNITVNISASDSESGIKQIILPNGNIITGSTGNYVISENGIYYFSAIDNNGNVVLKSITVSNIDRKIPTVTISNNTNWTNQNVIININAND